MKNTEAFLEEAILNIREDRAVTKTLLTDLLVLLKNDTEGHRNMGQVAAKYVETLQRSNEQLVKITALLQKKEGVSRDLSDIDKDEIFDIIKETN
tara:strand:+ start:911 stop:1195 length:285 start_codon:yes stop_codon:yes gene_type:complete